MSDAPSVLIIPGLNGDPGLLMSAVPVLFSGWRAAAFNHHHDVATDGVEGLAYRALDALESLANAPAAPAHEAGLERPADVPVAPAPEAALAPTPTPAPGLHSRVFVCGESFGGTVALTLAHLAPERVAGLILFSAFGWHPSMLARRGVGALALWSFLGGRVSTPLYRVGRLASLPTQLGVRFPPGLLQTYITRPRAEVAAYRTKAELSLTFDARPWLGTIEVPAFILTGRWDPVVPASAGRELARRMPNATLHAIGGGHLVHLVHARRVGDLIQAWARQLKASD